MGRWMMAQAVLLAGLLAMGCQPKEPDASAAASGPDPELAKMFDHSQSPEEAAPRTPTSDSVATTADVVPPPPPATIPKETSPPAPSKTVDVREVDFAGLEHELGQLKGKIVVIDCWATWCGICKEKFPAYLDLQRKHLARENVVFACLANDPVDKVDMVREYLSGIGAEMTCYLLDEDPADFAVHFDVDGVPAYLVYSVDGELIYKSGKVEELEAKLDEMLASAP